MSGDSAPPGHENGVVLHLAAAAGGDALGPGFEAGAAEASRKEVDGWVEIARRHGAAGVLTLRRKGGETAFQVNLVVMNTDGTPAPDALLLNAVSLNFIE